MEYKIGQIIPSSNITMEREVPRLFQNRAAETGERFSFHSTRIRMHRVTAAELKKMNEGMLEAACALTDAKVDLISTACLVATMCMGLGYHRRTEEEMLARTATNSPTTQVMTSAGALVEELKTFGARRIALMAPYSDELTAKVIEYIEAEGVQVQDARNFRIEDNLKVGQRDPMALVDDVKQLDTAGVDTVVLSACVQMPSLPAIEIVQDSLGIPVTSTAVCTVRQMLRKLGLSLYAPGAGAYLGSQQMSA